VDVVLLAIVPDVPLNAYVSVCVYADVFRDIVTVSSVPIVPEDADTVDLGAVSVIAQVLEPTSVFPEYVSHVIVHVPDAAEDI